MEKHLKIGKKAVFEKISIGKQWKGEKSAKSESGERAYSRKALTPKGNFLRNQ